MLMRKVENSPGELNIGNIISEVYLNSAMEEATEAAMLTCTDYSESC